MWQNEKTQLKIKCKKNLYVVKNKTQKEFIGGKK